MEKERPGGHPPSWTRSKEGVVITQNPRHWEIQYQLDRHRGIRRYRDTTQARDRIEWLIDQGFSCTAIAKAAGVDRGTVLDVRSGKNRMITLKIEKKIMAVTPEDIYARPDRRGYVPAIGAVRRIQALITMGWRYKDLNARCGIRTEKIGVGPWVSREYHEKIRKLYDELWNVQGPATKGNVTRALNKGWHRPMAWDDDTIDDPNAEPFGTVTGREAA